MISLIAIGPLRECGLSGMGGNSGSESNNKTRRVNRGGVSCFFFNELRTVSGLVVDES
jgi:hypothetical protein